MTASSTDPPLGTVIGDRYELLSLLGRGGYGLVFEARQLNTGQLVAVKVLLVDKVGSSRQETEIARFRREMKLIGQIRHPNVVRLIDSGQLDDGRLFLVLEYIEGETLATVLQRGPLPIRQALRLLRQVLEALAHAHATGVVHRDLKPHNIMVTDPGSRCNAMVVDFGVSFIAEEARDADYRTLTARDEVAGTPGYMAPEQLILGDVSPRADLYAWGLVALEALTGRPAVTETSLVKLVLRYGAAESIEVPECLQRSPFGAVLARATAVDPEQRYASAEEVLHDLEAIVLDPAELERLEAEIAALPPAAPRRGGAKAGVAPATGELDPTLDSFPGRPGEPSTGEAGRAERAARQDAGAVRLGVREPPRPAAAPADTLQGPPDSVELARPLSPSTPVEPLTPTGSSQPRPAPPAPRPHVTERTLLLGAALVIAGLLVVVVVDRLRPSESAAPGAEADADAGAAASPPATAPPDAAPSQTAWLPPAGSPGRGMVRIPAGSFTMGCNDNVDPNCMEDERPAHRVELDPYEIDVTEVTVAAYGACVEAGVCQAPTAYDPGRNPSCNWGHPERIDHPVNCLTWYDAQVYCEWLGKRLPTEAEWERAARGDDGRLYPWGDQAPDCSLAVLTTLEGGCTNTTTVEVGSRPAGASPFGALNLAGNVSEWVADWYEGDYYQNAPRRNPTGPPGGTERGERGADFNDDPSEMVVTRRESARPWDTDDDLGFRCARSVR